MIENMSDKLRQVAAAFRIPGELQGYEEIKRGNVNFTFRVDFLQEDGREKSYMVQKVNTYVFEHPVEVMENIDQVTEYIHAKDPHRTVLHFHHTKDRKTYLFDRDGFWRLFNFIPSKTYDRCDDPKVVLSAGRAFGEFQMLLGDFDASLLHETIPGFHDTDRRYDKLLMDAEVDPRGKVNEVRKELEWLVSVRDRACLLTRLFQQGELPLRVTHNDTKINNVLFDQNTSEAVVVIDLDTVMPGLVGHDFGDAIRFAANRVSEDSPDWHSAQVDMAIFQAFTQGFLRETASTLTEREVDTLALSCFAMTCELAVRFLDDYILGSPYFKIEYPEHNLVRARCQIALAYDMERRLGEMEQIIRDCMREFR